MIRRALLFPAIVAAFIALLVAHQRVHAQFNGCPAGFCSPPTVSTSGCSQATTFLARTALTGSDVTNYTNLICGLVTDGVITGDLSASKCGSHLDTFYVIATKDTTTAALNICSTSFSLTANGVPTFTAYSGYATTTPTDFVSSNWNFSTNGINYTQNAAHVSGWVVGSSTSTSAAPLITSAVDTAIYPKFTDNNAYLRVNDSSAGFANSNRQGFWLGNRSGASAHQAFLNGSSVNTGTDASSAPTNHVLQFLSDGTSGDTVDTIAAASSGGDMSGSSLQSLFYNRLRIYMTAVGVP